MKKLILLFCLTSPLSHGSVYSWRDVLPKSEVTGLILNFETLRFPEEAYTPFGGIVKGFAPTEFLADRLYDMIADLAAAPPQFARTYQTRFSPEERRLVRERLAKVADFMVAGEPYLKLALSKLERASNSNVKRPPLRFFVKELYRIAKAKIGGRRFRANDREAAKVAVLGLLNLRAFVDDQATLPELLPTAMDEVLEVLGDLPDLTHKIPFVAAFLHERLPLIDLHELSREYRRVLTLEQAREIALHVPAVLAALDRLEPAHVLKVRDGMRGRNSALALEHEQVIFAKARLNAAAGGLFGRLFRLDTLEANLAQARKTELTAHRLLHFEEILLDGAELNCADALGDLTAVVESAARPVLPLKSNAE